MAVAFVVVTPDCATHVKVLSWWKGWSVSTSSDRRVLAPRTGLTLMVPSRFRYDEGSGGQKSRRPWPAISTLARVCIGFTHPHGLPIVYTFDHEKPKPTRPLMVGVP